MKYATFLWTMALTATASATSSQMINGFHYASCSPKQDCVEVLAPQAWISLLHGGFSTAGETEMRVLSPMKDPRVFKGTSASFNGKMQMVTLEQVDGGVVTYTLEDSRLTVFAASGGGK